MREVVIGKLRRRIQQVSTSLVKEYSGKLLKQFTDLERELEIQLSYEQYERNN